MAGGRGEGGGGCIGGGRRANPGGGATACCGPSFPGIADYHIKVVWSRSSNNAVSSHFLAIRLKQPPEFVGGDLQVGGRLPPDPLIQMAGSAGEGHGGRICHGWGWRTRRCACIVVNGKKGAWGRFEEREV